jgi:hypothetical protein
MTHVTDSRMTVSASFETISGEGPYAPLSFILFFVPTT